MSQIESVGGSKLEVMTEHNQEEVSVWEAEPCTVRILEMHMKPSLTYFYI